MADETTQLAMGERTIRYPKQSSPGLEDASLPAVDGYNLAEFSLSPLGQRTHHLSGNTIRHEWTQIGKGGEERLCYFEKSYGSVAPNSETEDILLILTHLARQSDDPLTVETSIYEILKTKGFSHTPNKQQIAQVVRHLDALYGMSLKTNFVYDREKKDWKGVQTRVLGAYSYKDEAGKVRKRRVKKRRGKGEAAVEVVTEQRVMELSEVNFTSLFYRHFVEDSIPLDLGVYFALGLPTAKRLFRFGNKYVHTFGHHALDLQLFCISRIGMSPEYVEKHNASYLASKLRPYAQRVNETGQFAVEIEKSNATPSGYKITFDEPTVQMAIPSLASSYTQAEEKAHKLLIKQGLYANVARSIVIRCRKAIGKDAARYVRFVVGRFEREWIKTEKLSVPKQKVPGVLKTFFDKDWYYPHFIEWCAEKERKERAEESARYGGHEVGENPFQASYLAAFSGGGEEHPPKAAPSSFSLAAFREAFSEVYDRIVAAVGERYRLENIEGGSITEAQLAEMRTRAIAVYARQTWEAQRRGEEDYFPPTLEQPGLSDI